MTTDLATRPPTLEGEVVDPEFARLVDQVGLFSAIQATLWRNFSRAMMREFIKPEYLIDLPGVDRNLPVIDL